MLESYIRRHPGPFFTMLVFIVMVFVIVIFGSRNDNNQEQGPAPVASGSDQAQQEVSSQSAPSEIPSPEPPPPLSPPALPELTEADLTKVDQVVRIYGSFPNSGGKAATLDRLKGLVAPELLEAITQRWDGPDVKTATYTVTEVTLETGKIVGTKTMQVIVEAAVTQTATFKKTAPATFLPIYHVVLEQRDGRWVIVDIQEIGN